MTKADAGTRMKSGKGSNPPNMIASAAPNPAAAENPSVNGLAKGLERIVCICNPATPRQTPTSTPIAVWGMRNCHKIVAAIGSAP